MYGSRKVGKGEATEGWGEGVRKERERGRGTEKEEAGWRKWKREERQGKERGSCCGREERSTKKGRENGKRGDQIVHQEKPKQLLCQ